MPATVKGKLTIDGCELDITNPDKLLWPEDGITKLVYLQRLGELAPYLIKHCRGRYLTTIRYPNGIDGKSFYQKNCPQPQPPFVQLAEQSGIHYVHLDSLPTLLWLGNLAALEFHASFDRINEPLVPTEWVLDLDPSQDEEPRIMEAAMRVGDVLHSLGIRSIPKTSGATGVQITVPLQRDLSFDELRHIGLFIGEYLTSTYPDLFTIERLKKNRGKLIYVDYLQHYQGKTLSAPYTPRARPGAPVSTPLTWDEVRRSPHPTEFNLLTIGKRLSQMGDLMEQTEPQQLRPILEFISKR
ncbi:non-homologous end-joining DNA ligase [Paenibacillus daejeonensis]|uniref:non-homologous end-joining DNA ligase n=1 Tax=Paenibacillus daejeonensis TaxID=135193 RepID=UPI0003743E0D|nr:non-homologous end-joining DNA ligase [Paenibacillus daejeonensis]